MEEMSAAEREANAEKLLAEARKADAEAQKLRADAELVSLEVQIAHQRLREATAEAEKAMIEATKVMDEDRARRASDEFHRLYRFSDPVNAQTVARCMKKLTEWHREDPVCQIEVVFSSPGGSIFDGMELFDHIRQLSAMGHRTVTGGTGMAASMAGILLQAGDHRWISRECWVLIHRAAFFAAGQTQDVEDQVRLVKRIEQRIIDIFVSRSGGRLTAQKIRRNWERKDWWLDSDECLALGLVDEVRGALG